MMAVYGAYCFLVAATSLVSARAWRVAARTAGLVPILAGYVLATIGWLGLAWIVGDLAGPGEASEGVAPGLTCETASWGSAASASGHALHLYCAWPLGLRRQVAVFSVTETAPADPDISCADALQRYRAAFDR